MSDIKAKDMKPKSIKTMDKAVAWTERIKDPIAYVNKKTKDISTGQENIIDYGEDKIKYTTNRIKDELVYASKKTINYTKDKTINYVKKKYQQKKLIKNKPNDIKGKSEKTRKTVKSAERTIKNTEKAAKEGVKASKIIVEQGRKLAIEGTKKAIKGTKVAIKIMISAIKGMIASVKSLVGMLAAGGSLAIIAIIIICMIGLVVTSIFGIFFSSDKSSGNAILMSDCVAELNTELDNRIKTIKNNNPHDEVVIHSNRAEWKDILSVYSVKVNKGTNEEEVMTITTEKKKVLQEVFWNMNYLTFETKNEKYGSQSIGTLDRPQLDLSLNGPRNTNEEEKTILHIYINSKSVEDMKIKYNFNEEQKKQFAEINSEKYLSMWSSVIYGTFGSSGEITEWKQVGKEWSNIQIGNSGSTIGQIGCLTTSISILIKKSQVPTNMINPFNPGTFVIALNNNYGFDESGNLQYLAISKVVPNFEYVDRVELKGKSKDDKLYEIQKYYSSGYYLALEVKGATKNSQHWVAVDNVNNNSILMLDPASTETDVWSQYDWEKTSQFVYFKVKK